MSHERDPSRAFACVSLFVCVWVSMGGVVCVCMCVCVRACDSVRVFVFVWWFVGYYFCLFVCLFVCSVGRSVGWLVGRLAGWFVGWLVGWLVGCVCFVGVVLFVLFVLFWFGLHILCVCVTVFACQGVCVRTVSRLPQCYTEDKVAGGAAHVHTHQM